MCIRDRCEIITDLIVDVITAGDPGCPLDQPELEVINFNGQAQNDETVLLTWNVINELENTSYTVEHSTDGETFLAIGALVGDQSEDYQFVDEFPIFGINYYRLKIQLEDGSFTYSPIIEIELRLESEKAGITFPNPAVGEVYLRMIEPFETDTQIEVVNAFGEILSTIIAPRGTGQVTIDLSLIHI